MFFAIQPCLIVVTFSVIILYKYRPQMVGLLPACPGDLQACSQKWIKVTGKCAGAGVPSIYILQPVDGARIGA